MDQDPLSRKPPNNDNHQSQYNWLSPLRDIQPNLFNPNAGSYPEDNHILDIDPGLFTERATNISMATGRSTNLDYPYPTLSNIDQTLTWPALSTAEMDLVSVRNTLQNQTHWPTYQGQSTQTRRDHTGTPTTNPAHPTPPLITPISQDSTLPAHHHNTRNQPSQPGYVLQPGHTQSQHNTAQEPDSPQERGRHNSHPRVPSDQSRQRPTSSP